MHFKFRISDITITLVASSLLFIIATVFCIWSGNQTKWPDESIYVGIAERLVAGLGFTNEVSEPSAFRPPGYPFILYFTYKAHESVFLAKFVNVLALTATAWVLNLLVHEVSPSGRVFAPLLVLAYPLFTFSSSVLVPQIVGGLMFVLVVYWLIKYPKSFVSAAACGFTFGALILTIPSFALVFFCLTALMILANQVAQFYSTKFVGLFFLATILVVCPWIVRSSLLFDRFVFISTNSGINLLFGNSENAAYDTGVVDISKYSDTAGMNEAELDGYYQKAALAWVSNHPLDATVLYLQKVANYFNYKNRISTSSQENVFRNALMFVAYYPLLIAAAIRFALWRKYRFTWPEILLYLLYFGNAFLSAIVYTRLRYRIPFDFLLVAMVSIFLGHLRASKFWDPLWQTHS